MNPIKKFFSERCQTSRFSMLVADLLLLILSPLLLYAALQNGNEFLSGLASGLIVAGMILILFLS